MSFLIAAPALQHDHTILTRNTAHFVPTEACVLDPMESQAPALPGRPPAAALPTRAFIRTSPLTESATQTPAGGLNTCNPSAFARSDWR